MVHLNLSRQYPAFPFAADQRAQQKVEFLEIARAAAVRIWFILLVMGEHKARHRYSR